MRFRLLAPLLVLSFAAGCVKANPPTDTGDPVVSTPTSPSTSGTSTPTTPTTPTSGTTTALAYNQDMKALFQSDCVTCHGINADGNGRAARLHNPRPANLRMSDKNDAYIRLIVTRGGEALGRSPGMPPWGEELTDEQISDVTAFVRSVNMR